MPTNDMPSSTKQRATQWLWLIGLYAGGVGVVTGIAYLIRLWIL